MKFSEDKRQLLFKEASLSAMNLGVGLTFLRKSNFAQTGFIYQSFFSLSIGIERLIKLMLVYEYYGQNKSFPPDGKYLKSRGHDLSVLFDEAEKLAVNYNCLNYFDRFRKEPICQNILKNLSDFARRDRYFHLDELSNASINSVDPLKKWDKEVNQLIVQKHKSRKNSEHDELMKVASVVDKNSHIRHINEQGLPIDDFTSLIQESSSVEKKQKYSMFYTYIIIRALCELQENQNRHFHSNAFLNEFFVAFRNHPDNYVLRKKTWNPHSPYKF